jgi:hypothetical protein
MMQYVITVLVSCSTKTFRFSSDESASSTGLSRTESTVALKPVTQQASHAEVRSCSVQHESTTVGSLEQPSALQTNREAMSQDSLVSRIAKADGIYKLSTNILPTSKCQDTKDDCIMKIIHAMCSSPNYIGMISLQRMRASNM